MISCVIYTDLDESLLDHNDYSYAPAASLLAELESSHIPVVPCTSKTRRELLPLREELGNRHPFVFENGAGVAIPHGYFDDHKPENARSKGGFWIRSFTLPRKHWLTLIAQVAQDFHGEYRGFSAMSDVEVARLTGLPVEQARLARQREYGEPVHWLGTPERLRAFSDTLQRAGAVVLQGGRFIHVSGRSDKGQALRWLNGQYAIQNGGRPPVSIAAGDSQNDIAMLETADRALIIQSPSHAAPRLRRKDHLYYSIASGPAGWTEGIRHFMASN
jgi:mannosyl-3-phosphoglycerate phosphatase family protein